jgi:hypothetical protein
MGVLEPRMYYSMYTVWAFVSVPVIGIHLGSRSTAPFAHSGLKR